VLGGGEYIQVPGKVGHPATHKISPVVANENGSTDF
jgi:hypothetical protein